LPLPLPLLLNFIVVWQIPWSFLLNLYGAIELIFWLLLSCKFRSFRFIVMFAGFLFPNVTKLCGINFYCFLNIEKYQALDNMRWWELNLSGDVWWFLSCFICTLLTCMTSIISMYNFYLFTVKFFLLLFHFRGEWLISS
jgi:hypothetical protein